MTPCARMESASSLRLSSSKLRRGCCAFGRMRSASISRSCSGSASGFPNKALSPRPRAFLCAMNDLLCQADIGLGSFGLDVVQQNRLPVAGGFSQSNIAGNEGRKDAVAEESLQIFHYLT